MKDESVNENGDESGLRVESGSSLNRLPFSPAPTHVGVAAIVNRFWCSLQSGGRNWELGMEN